MISSRCMNNARTSGRWPSEISLIKGSLHDSSDLRSWMGLRAIKAMRLKASVVIFALVKRVTNTPIKLQLRLGSIVFIRLGSVSMISHIFAKSDLFAFKAAYSSSINAITTPWYIYSNLNRAIFCQFVDLKAKWVLNCSLDAVLMGIGVSSGERGFK